MNNTPWRRQRNPIQCCNGCKPPKRYPGCGDHCPEYKKEKAKYVADKQREKEYLKSHPPVRQWDTDRYK